MTRLTLLLAVGMVACSEYQEGPTTPPQAPAMVARVVVAPAQANITVGLSKLFSASAYDANGNLLTGRTVKWSTGNTVALAITSNGLVTAMGLVGGNSASITATVEGVTSYASIAIKK